MGVDQRVLLVGGGSEDLGEELEQAHLPFRFQTFRCWEQLVSDSQEKIDIILAEDMPKQGYEVPGDPPVVVLKPAFQKEFMGRCESGAGLAQLLVEDTLARYFSSGAVRRAVILDDDFAIRRALSAMFKRFGFEVEANGTRELDLDGLKNEFIDLLVVDMNMPGLEWEDFLDFVAEASPATRIYLATGDRSVKHCSRLSGVLYKPFGIGEVAKVARSVLLGHPKGI